MRKLLEDFKLVFNQEELTCFLPYYQASYNQQSLPGNFVNLTNLIRILLNKIQGLKVSMEEQNNRKDSQIREIDDNLGKQIILHRQFRHPRASLTNIPPEIL